MKIGARNASLHFDHTVLAELIARRWKHDRAYFTPSERARGAWLQAPWWWQPGRSALELHWSRRAVSADLLPPPQAMLDGAA